MFRLSNSLFKGRNGKIRVYKTEAHRFSCEVQSKTFRILKKKTFFFLFSKTKRFCIYVAAATVFLQLKKSLKITKTAEGILVTILLQPFIFSSYRKCFCWIWRGGVSFVKQMPRACVAAKLYKGVFCTPHHENKKGLTFDEVFPGLRLFLLPSWHRSKLFQDFPVIFHESHRVVFFQRGGGAVIKTKSAHKKS